MENAVLKAERRQRAAVSAARSAIAASSARTPTSSARRSATAASSPAERSVFNGATLEDGSGVALGGIVHVKLAPDARRERADAAHRVRRSGDDLSAARRRRRFTPRSNFFADVFNLEAGDDVRARAAETYAKFLRKAHAQDSALDEHRNAEAAAAPLGRGAAANAGRPRSTRSST